MRKLKHREVKLPAQGHTVNNWVKSGHQFVRPQSSGSVHLVSGNQGYHAGQLVIMALFLPSHHYLGRHVKKKWHEGSRVFRRAQAPVRTNKPSLLSHQDGWCQQNFLLGNILFWTWQPVSWVAMVTRGPWGAMNIKGGLETQSSPSPPASLLAGDSLWQTLTCSGNPTPPYSCTTRLNTPVFSACNSC